MLFAKRVGEVSKVLGGGRFGSRVQAGNAEKLAQAIEWVYRNREEAQSRALAAKKRALTFYGVQRMAEQYFEQYRTLILRYERQGVKKFG